MHATSDGKSLKLLYNGPNCKVEYTYYSWCSHVNSNFKSESYYLTFLNHMGKDYVYILALVT